MNDLATAGGWVGLLILGGFSFASEWLKRRATRRADQERGPIEGFTALTTAQADWANALRGETTELRAELAAVRGELAAARLEIAALRLQVTGGAK